MQRHIKPQEINELPLRTYQGDVDVITDPGKIITAVEEIHQHEIVGFDTESKPAFRKGEYNPVALIQMATRSKVYLFRVSMTGLTKDITEVFSNPDIKKVGVAIQDDIRELQRLREFNPEAFLDLAGEMDKIGVINRGLRGITALLLGYRISKNQQTSNWESKELTRHQIDYAATDAWASLEIYDQILKLS